MKRIIIYMVWILFALIAFSSCSKQKSNVVAIAAAEMHLDRWEHDIHYLKEFFDTQNYKVNIVVAEDSYETQISQIKGLIEQGVEVIILIPVQSKGYREVIDMARQKGVKIIAYDRLVKDADIDFYITFDNLQVGVSQANYLISNSNARIFSLINGPETDNNSTMLRRGQLSVLNSYRLRHRVSIITDIMVDEYSEQAGYDAFVEIVNKEEIPDAVIAGNDAIARGVIKAIEDQGIENGIFIVGQDADRESLEYIRDGKQVMTIYKPIKRLANIAGEVAISYIEGLSPDEYNLSSTYNGFKNVSTIIIGTIVVDNDNIDETVVLDGFVEFEDDSL